MFQTFSVVERQGLKFCVIQNNWGLWFFKKHFFKFWLTHIVCVHSMNNKGVTSGLADLLV